MSNFDVALRFVVIAGNVDFYENEVLKSNIKFNKAYNIFNNQAIHPDIKYIGDLQKQLLFQVKKINAETETKVNQLIDENAELTVYYAYGAYSTSKSSTCIRLPKGKKKTFVIGEPAAEIYQLIFLFT